MSDTMTTITDSIETDADLPEGDAGLWSYWKAEDEIAAKEEEVWRKQGRAIVKRYRDERPRTTNLHRFNILWSNVQTLIPTLYARTPKADVQRRFLDQDDTGRLASILLERSLSYSLEKCDFDAMMLACVQDRLLPGRGVPRVMYIPHFGDPLPEVELEGETVDNPGDQPEPTRELVYEEVVAVYQYWEDYREGPARTRRETPWIRFGAYMTRDELIKRFGKKIGSKVNLDVSPKGIRDTGSDRQRGTPDIHKKAEVWEIWDKIKKRVIWMAPGTPDLILDDVDDPLRLSDFYPAPDPLLATTTTDRRVPVPDYVEYQDQANELDLLTARIDRLTRALKVSGVYPGSLKVMLNQLVDDSTENKLIPVEDWAMLMDKGGMQGAILWFPIEQVAQTLVQLYAAREKTKDLLYEITGIGDIMRGQTSPNETLGAQQLKANFSTRRIVPQQRDVARLACDVIRLMAGVIAEHFQTKTISMITGYPQLAPVPEIPPQPPQFIPAPMPQQGALPPSGMMVGPQGAPQPNPAYQQWLQAVQAAQAIVAANQVKQQQFDAACKLIRDDGVRGFKLDIEADSTIAPDEQAEQQSRIQFLQQMVPLMQNLAPMAMGQPGMAKIASELAMFVVRGFRVARTLEDAIEAGFAELAKMPAPPPKGAGHGADPAIEQAKVAADVHDTQTKAQIEQMAISQKAQQAAQQLEATRERTQAEMEHNQDMMAMQAAELQQRERLESARVNKLQSSSARGLA